MGTNPSKVDDVDEDDFGKIAKGLKEVNDKEKREQYEEENSFKSPLVLSLDAKFFFNSNPEPKDLQKLSNYGRLPISVINHLLSFHQPIDLINLFCTCQLFYEVSCTNHFWKRYFYNYYGIGSSSKMEESNVDLNWKKQFFKSFKKSDLAEHQFLRKFEIDIDLEKYFDPKHIFGVVGKDGIGKEQYIKKFEEIGGPPRNDKTVFSILDRNNRNAELNKHWFQLRVLNVGEMKDPRVCKILDGYLLCFDLCDESSFQVMKKKFYPGIKKKNEHFKGVDTKLHRLNVVVVGFSGEKRLENRKVSKKSVIDFVRKNKLKGYIEVSVKNGCNVHLPVGVLFEKVRQKEDEREEDRYGRFRNYHLDEDVHECV